MSKDNEVVIVSAVRTAIGKLGGALKGVRATQLGAHVMLEAIKRANDLDPNLIEEVIFGDCVQCFDEANTARTAVLTAGLPFHIPAFTVQRQCSSSMQALNCGVQQIRCGDAEVVMVGGVESMSSAPYYLANARWGMRLMNHEVTDAVWEMLHSGSRLLGEPMIMGVTAENLAEKYGISREDQDQLALESHNKAEAAIKAGRFEEEIVPLEVPGEKGRKVVFDQDEHPRFGLTMEDLARLKPVFKKNGTVTPGNSSGLNDGGAAAILMTRKRARELGLAPMARIVSQAAAGVEPHLMGYGPVPSTEKAIKKAGMSLKDIQLVELNEAFAAQYIACERGLGLDRTITNVNGSGVGLGHPVGCTGLRIVVSLIHEMARRNLEVGLATLCVGGGMGMSTIVVRD
ncbi:thiolase family protein [Desulforhabdus amnigena]|jgi:acetyl-CoA C-acetyltransferase|uniref:Acetyl-CoA acetyltransferase n=1 Tax=Desulforhabdus amnigena TaxID=40218 RepID=A0A9W6FQU1_9BACT|nr:thiolase family protein [Desulforhabdus amnigena]NLJ29152.1 thiolase family protein [Deltaproteobacteria bacterium]GLI32837.1 acetyl-CoA acetyltransferase [Desulforhabdus amnigena]